MPEKKEMLFTAGQFAKMHHINKRTLHYYDNIGLFSPSCKGENGYRYYTYLQSMTLEMLLTLRELGMPIEEISAYMQNRSVPTLQKILSQRRIDIDNTIKRLKDIKKMLQDKENLLNLCQQADLGEIRLVECQEEYLMLSRSITGALDDADLAVLVEHTQSLEGPHLYNRIYGSMISVEKVLAGNFDKDDCFYIKVPSPQAKQRMLRCAVEPNVQEKLFLKPGGTYLRAYCKGGWDLLPAAFGRMAAFAESKGYTLTGYAYEEGVNEMAVNSMEEYITQIDILGIPS